MWLKIFINEKRLYKVFIFEEMKQKIKSTKKIVKTKIMNLAVYIKNISLRQIKNCNELIKT